MQSAKNDFGKGNFLRNEALFEASLHDTAAVLVTSNLIATDHASVEDEVGVDSKLLSSLNILVSWLV